MEERHLVTGRAIAFPDSGRAGRSGGSCRNHLRGQRDVCYVFYEAAMA